MRYRKYLHGTGKRFDGATVRTPLLAREPLRCLADDVVKMESRRRGDPLRLIFRRPRFQDLGYLTTERLRKFLNHRFRVRRFNQRSWSCPTQPSKPPVFSPPSEQPRGKHQDLVSGSDRGLDVLRQSRQVLHDPNRLHADAHSLFDIDTSPGRSLFPDQVSTKPGEVQTASSPWPHSMIYFQLYTANSLLPLSNLQIPSDSRMAVR